MRVVLYIPGQADTEIRPLLREELPMQQNSSPALQAAIAEGVNLTSAEVSEAAVYLMADFSGEQVSDFIQKLAKAHNLPVAVFSEADVVNIYDVRRRRDGNDKIIEGAGEITPAEIEKVMTDPRWDFMADNINEPRLAVISQMVDQL
jgi:hypothetical protein